MEENEKLIIKIIIMFTPFLSLYNKLYNLKI